MRDASVCENAPNEQPPVLLLRVVEAAAACRTSLRTWRVWNAAARIPRPIRIGRSLLWRAEELRAWIEAGCPRRQEWESGRK